MLGFEEALDGKAGAGQGAWKEEEYTMRSTSLLHNQDQCLTQSVAKVNEPILPDEISAF